MSMVSNEGRAVVERIWKDVVTGGELDAIDDLVAEQYTYRAPGGIELRGPDGFRRFVEALHDLFDGLRIDVHEYVVEDDRVVSRWTGRGTYRETGEEIRWEGATITHVADGQMIDDWEYWDRLELAEQLADGWLQTRLVKAVAKRSTEHLPES